VLGTTADGGPVLAARAADEAHGNVFMEGGGRAAVPLPHRRPGVAVWPSRPYTVAAH
jgi:hypothetical protein